MYGQFHNAHSFRTTRTTSSIERNIFLSSKSNKMKTVSFISLILVAFVLSTSSFAGSSKPQLPGGNGNAQGR